MPRGDRSFPRGPASARRRRPPRAGALGQRGELRVELALAQRSHVEGGRARQAGDLFEGLEQDAQAIGGARRRLAREAHDDAPVGTEGSPRNLRVVGRRASDFGADVGRSELATKHLQQAEQLFHARESTGDA